MDQLILGDTIKTVESAIIDALYDMDYKDVDYEDVANEFN